jgi:hypothetical protein
MVPARERCNAIEEIAIAEARLTRTLKVASRFLRSFS